MSRSIRPTIPVIKLKNGTEVTIQDWSNFLRPFPPSRGVEGHTEGWRWGVIFRLASFWVGVHYSKRTQRWCINPIPGVTLWLAKPGGQVPEGPDFDSQPQINHPLTLFP